jgi:hypothetical protein
LGTFLSGQPLLQGEVVFGDDAASFKDATLYVYLLNPVEDDDAIIVQQLVNENVAYDARSKNRLPFVFYGEIPDERAHYLVSVLVDLDQDGKASYGDYISIENYPVLTRDNPNKVSIRVKLVKPISMAG